MENILELCSICGKVILPVSELLNNKVVYIDGYNKRKEADIKSCNTCYGSLLKYTIDDLGFFKVDSDFKYNIIKQKKISNNKKEKIKGDLIIPRITIKGKEKLEKIDPWILGEIKTKSKKKDKETKDNFYNNLNKLLGRKLESTNYNKKKSF
jgi:hypothetical protein